MTTISSERPNIVRGSTRLIQRRGRISNSVWGSGSAESTAGPNSRSVAAVIRTPSVRLEGIAGAAHRLQVTREARIALDLAAQPRHLDIDVAHVAAELGRARQLFARYRLASPLGERGEQPRFGRCQMHGVTATEELTAIDIEAAAPQADFARSGVRRRPALQDVADTKNQLARLERL